MNRTEMTAAVANQAGLSRKEAEAAIDAFTNTLKEIGSAGDSYTLKGLGSFKGKLRPARKARNPATGATVDVPEKKVLTFSMSKSITL